MNSSLKKAEKPFSLWLFVITVGGFFLAYNAVVGAIMWKFFPHLFALQLSASLLSLVGTFFGMKLLNAFVEYFFHRYMLHARVIPFLAFLYKKHTFHHGKTHLVLRLSKRTDGTAAFIWVIENRFPITKPEQHEASFFPWYAFPVFSGLATLLFAMVASKFPQVPIFLGGSLAIACSLFLYEVLHAMQHWSLKRWEPLLNHLRYGKMFRLIYGHHLGHHAQIRCNESISGFFGLPVADWLFKTLTVCPTLFVDGKEAVGQEVIFIKIPPRVRFIRWLDWLAELSLRRWTNTTVA